MFAQAKNTKALQQAQRDIELLLNEFEKKIFIHQFDNVEIKLQGDEKVLDISSVNGDLIDALSVMQVYHRARAELEHERSIGLVKIRNAVMKKYKMDLSTILPDIAKAVSILNKEQKQKTV